MDWLRKIWKARTKRCVTRFFFHQEELRASKFIVFPEVISSWMLHKSSTSMYPGDGIPPQDTILTSFEMVYCPWYIEYNGWDTYHSLAEEELPGKVQGRGYPNPSVQCRQATSAQ